LPHCLIALFFFIRVVRVIRMLKKLRRELSRFINSASLRLCGEKYSFVKLPTATLAAVALAKVAANCHSADSFYRITRAPAPFTIFSTSALEAIEVSPGVVIAKAP